MNALAEGIKARMQVNGDNIKTRQENLKKTLESLEKRAKMHEAGATGRSKARIAQDQATNAMIKQYKNVESRYSALEREQTALDKEIADKPIDSWMTGRERGFKARSDKINAKRVMLDGPNGYNRSQCRTNGKRWRDSEGQCNTRA